MRQLIGLTGAACLHAKTMALNLEVDASRMSANLELTGGLMMAERVVFALAPTLGKAKAKALLEAACKDALASKRHLRDVLASMPEAAGLDLDSLFDPTTYFGASDEFIDRILKRNSDSRDVTP
jgi:3-carboxy-cis,cis-muconate cycloisomerase